MVKIRKPPFLKGIGKCIFCGGTGLSKEHVFGDWLKELFPRDARTTHTSAEIRWSKHILTEHPIDQRRKRQGHSGSLKLRVVCEQCNNGWLSRLEASAKETLRPLILGFRGALLPEAQTRVAVWAAKTAMVATNFRPRIPEITQEECSFLMREGRPPNTNWYVWIAPYSGTIWRHLTIFQDRGGLSPKPLHNGDLAPHYIQATTFGLGHVLFTALSSSSPQVPARFLMKDWPGILQIWPPQERSILWPGPKILDDEDAKFMSNMLRSTEVFDHSLDPAKNWVFNS